MNTAIINFFKDLGLSLIPIFVAIDAIGVLPFIMSLTQDVSSAERPRVIRYALLTAFGRGWDLSALEKVSLLL